MLEREFVKCIHTQACIIQHIKCAEEEMDAIYQAADKDFNFFEAQVKELDAERNQSIITSIFITLTGTRMHD